MDCVWREMMAVCAFIKIDDCVPRENENESIVIGVDEGKASRVSVLHFCLKAV